MIFCPVLGVSCIRACRGQAGGSVAHAVRCWVNVRLHHQSVCIAVRDCDLLRWYRLSRAVCSPFWLDPLVPTRRCASTGGSRGLSHVQARLVHPLGRWGASTSTHSLCRIRYDTFAPSPKHARPLLLKQFGAHTSWPHTSWPPGSGKGRLKDR